MKKNKKTKYIKPKIKVILFNKEDIITTSGPTSVENGLFGSGNGGVNVG